MSQLPFGCRNMTVRPCSARPCARSRFLERLGTAPTANMLAQLSGDLYKLRRWCYFISGMLVGTEMFWRRYERLDGRGESVIWNQDLYLLVQTMSNGLS